LLIASVAAMAEETQEPCRTMAHRDQIKEAIVQLLSEKRPSAPPSWEAKIPRMAELLE
jgi:hypothetical protein